MILITREHSKVTSLITALGNHQITTIPMFSTLKNNARHSFLESEIYIFISQYSVEYFCKTHTPDINKKTIAVGPATAKSLQQQNWQAIIPKQDFSSNGILELADLTNIKNKIITIICGQPFSKYLGDKLIARGAQVIYYPVYKREMPTQNNIEKLIKLNNQSLTAITFSSIFSLNNFHILIQKYQLTNLGKCCWIVVNKQMFSKIRGWGYNNRIIVTDNATNTAIIKAIKDNF